MEPADSKVYDHLLSKIVTDKYAKIEYERRFLVTSPPQLSACRYTDIVDQYLDVGRLRLRKVTHADGETQYKLCKKYAPRSATMTPIVNIYLDEAEYTTFAILPAQSLSKRRYYLESDRGMFAIDAFEGNLAGLYLAEAERDSEASLAALELPSWINREVTHEPEYQGANLAKTTYAKLLGQG